MHIAEPQAIGYPHISSDSRILKGVPIVEGTRTPVRSIANYFNIGMTVDEILVALPFLNFGQVFAALSYYFDHKSEIDTNITENNDVDRWQRMAKMAQRPS